MNCAMIEMFLDEIDVRVAVRLNTVEIDFSIVMAWTNFLERVMMNFAMNESRMGSVPERVINFVNPMNKPANDVSKPVCEERGIIVFSC